MKKRILFLVLFLLIFTTGISYAQEYTIDSYHIKMEVNEDNSFNITESIGANFYVQKHGIIREIPRVNEVVRLDGTRYKNRAKIKDISVTDKVKVSNSGTNKVIRIGNPDKTLIGEKYYEISYTYILGDDKTKEYDELYFNLIGDGWDTSIDNISFEINMPKKFDEEKIGFSSGRTGSVWGYDLVDYVVEGNSIKGKYTEMLRAGEAFTIRLELPEGYFTPRTDISKWHPFMSGFTMLISFVVSFIIWLTRGRQDEIVETVEFYPPNDYNSLDTAFFYKGEVNSQDIISLLIYLGNKGYLTIEEIDKKGFLSRKNDFRIHKGKPYDGKNRAENLFLKGLFNKGDIVSASDLRNSFYITVQEINKITNDRKNKNMIYIYKTMQKLLIRLMMLLTIVVVIGITLYEYFDGFAGVIVGIVFVVFFIMLLTPIKIGESYRFIHVFITLTFLVIAGAMLHFVGELKELIPKGSGVLIYGLAFLLLFIMNFLATNLTIRTSFGAQILGRIRGFKRFIEFAEKERIEELIEDNPQYFYHIIPYAYVLGVSSRWIDRFETLNIKEAPEFYHGSNFNSRTFSKFMNNTVSYANNSLAYTPSSSGGSSGGGSSGGGSGGGGGSSW